MNRSDKDDDQYLDEDSFFQDDYEEDAFDDEFEEEDLEFEDESDFDPAMEPAPEDESRLEDHTPGSQQEDYSQTWPLGLFAAGIIALLLLVAGGYGVLQQRADTQKEVRMLRAKLATTTSNSELAENRQAQRNLQIHNKELQAQVELLQAEIKGMREELAQVKIEAPAETSTPVVKPAITQKTVSKIENPPPKAPPTAEHDAWFVNFGSYKSKATAEQWASRLSVDSGRVAVLSGDKKGTRYYRVRVMDLPSKEIAGKIALQLEKTHHLSHLWVGKQ